MRAIRLSGLVMILLGAVTAAAQQSVPEQTVSEMQGLRVQWTVEPQTRDFTAVCGQVVNTQRTSARNVGLMVLGVDGERVVSRNVPNVAREIVGESGWQFCGTVAKAPSYRVIITSVDWDVRTGQ